MKIRLFTLLSCLFLALSVLKAAPNDALWSDINVYSTDGTKYSTLFDTDRKVYRIYTNGSKECVLRVVETKYDYVYVIVGSPNMMPRYIMPTESGSYFITIDNMDEDVCLLFSTEPLDPTKIVPKLRADDIFSGIKVALDGHLVDQSDIRYIINNIGFSSLSRHIAPVYIEVKSY